MNKINKTIIDQIGNKALAMMGTKKVVADDENDSVIFLIGKNPERVNRIVIRYDAEKDLYDMEFYKFIGKIYIRKTYVDIYFDKLHSMIEDKTGLYL